MVQSRAEIVEKLHSRVVDMSIRKALIALLLAPVALSAQSRARNVILFLADAGGTSTIAAAW